MKPDITIMGNVRDSSAVEDLDDDGQIINNEDRNSSDIKQLE